MGFGHEITVAATIPNQAEKCVITSFGVSISTENIIFSVARIL